MYDLCNVILESIHYYTHILHMDIRKIKPYLEKKIVKGNTYYQLLRKTRIDGKVKRVWSKYLGTPETIEKVYNGYEEQTSLQLTSFEYGRTAALIKIFDELGIKPSTLFFDTTNFFTYIEHGEDIPRKGKSKEMRYDKNLVGLGLAVSDTSVPFFHETYSGNIQDFKSFAIIFDKIVERLDSIDVTHEDIVLVIDKGCNSKINISKVISKMHIVGSVKKNQAEELYDVSLDEFDLLYETKKKHKVLGYRIKKEVFGTEFTLVVRYHPGSYKKQKQTYEKKKVEILEKLHKIKYSVERVGKGKKKSITNALLDASKVIPDDYKKVFPFEGFEKENVFTFSFDEEAEKKLELNFGKTILFTDMHGWDTEKIVKTYNPGCPKSPKFANLQP
ncbi:Transposase [Candidatus Methanomarinus sp.]|nr:Transposase [ANME-2 cluster archaeon]